ncbi:MAG: hypothetical protein AAF531_03970 [Actinomycetota bacterium]
MPTSWNRVEAAARSIPLRDGLAARVADPLWALARQHQVGEFRGDDAAQPAAVRVAGTVVPLQSFRGLGVNGGKNSQPVPLADEPLEARVERTATPDFGGGSLNARVRAGARLTRQLRRSGFHPAADRLTEAYGTNRSGNGPVVEELVVDSGLARAAASLLADRGLDGLRLVGAPEVKVHDLITAALEDEGFEPDDVTKAIDLFDQWRKWCTEQHLVADPDTWDQERLEHRFSVAGAGPRGEVALEVPEHWGGHLDWYSFDISQDKNLLHGLKEARSETITATAVPTAVRYTGMPASRWWEFEDNTVHFGDLEAGPADLARLLVAEFATVYGDDWFVIPVTVPLSSLVEVATVDVIDNFDESLTVDSLAYHDSHTNWAKRPWRFFELTGDVLSNTHPSPWLLIPPAVTATTEGPAIEQVAFSRDEGANLAWGIERTIEGPLGRPIDRAAAWAAAHPPTHEPPPANRPVRPDSLEDEFWRYRLESTAPPWWVPLAPERIRANSAQVRLRRNRMDNWADLSGPGIGPHSQVLDPHRPLWIREEEVPKSGVRLERRWQLTRWHDGSVHLWLQRRKRPGRGDASSGVRWDLLDEPPAEDLP